MSPDPSQLALFLIDEPDIYLHSDLQRQLLGLLRNMGPDILIATHSTEIITEAETDDIVLINKHRKTGKRIKHPSQLEEVFKILGSNLNPILTQLARTKRAVFVEGKDFQIIGKFAQKLNFTKVGNRSDFAVIPVEGFNPERIRSLKAGMEATLGTKIDLLAILDKDYRCDAECASIADECKVFCNNVVIHRRKEIENFLLVPDAIDRAVVRKIADRVKRGGQGTNYSGGAAQVLDAFATEKKSYVSAQYVHNRRRFERMKSPTTHETVVTEQALQEVENSWSNASSRLDIIAGKDAMRAINEQLQARYGISVTATAVIDAMAIHEIPTEMKDLITAISEFASTKRT